MHHGYFSLRLLRRFQTVLRAGRWVVVWLDSLGWLDHGYEETVSTELCLCRFGVAHVMAFYVKALCHSCCMMLSGVSYNLAVLALTKVFLDSHSCSFIERGVPS